MMILLPTALPGGLGIGDFGCDAYAWFDFLVGTGVGFWPVLPFGPTDYIPFSPYSSSSS
jgi:4-alpha-glucanotransferase